MRGAMKQTLTALLLALLFAGCADEPRALCNSERDCARFCAQLGLPTEQARCVEHSCVCLLPEPTPDAVADAPSELADADTAPPDLSEPDTLDTSPDTAPDTTVTDTGHADDDAQDTQSDDGEADTADSVDTVEPRRCPPDMVDRGAFCIDRYEAPNFDGALPLVMFTFDEAEAWCGARDKRLCFDDEWTSTCAGPAATAYPYGDQRQPGVCNDDETWRAYNQSRLSNWPWGLPTSQIDSLSGLLDAARATGPAGVDAAAHIVELYQAEPSGENTGCTNDYGAFDLVGNVEEWTRRRDGGEPNFHGNLKGRYWADTRTCQNNITSHADGFRFYELGFRCCRDAVDP